MCKLKTCHFQGYFWYVCSFGLICPLCYLYVMFLEAEKNFRAQQQQQQQTNKKRSNYPFFIKTKPIFSAASEC